MTIRVSVDPARLSVHDELVTTLVNLAAASKLAAGDSRLWGPDAEAEAAIRMGWTTDPLDMLPLVDQLVALREDLAGNGVTRFVLCGMGGSSLAPEVIAGQAGVALEILDSTHPDQVVAALGGDLDSTAVIVSSKSGTTVETATTRAAFQAAFVATGIDPTSRVFIVTDPDSPLHREAEAAGHTVFLADPTVGGRFSALTAFGLVPATLAGADTASLIRDAHQVWSDLHVDRADNPAIALAAALSDPTRDIAVLLPSADLPGLGDWIEQLVAESTGKDGLGVLPVVTSSPTAPERSQGNEDTVIIGLDPANTDGLDVSIHASLGASFLLWEYATALVGILRGLNPFDQPDVESAKVAARGLLEATPDRPAPRATGTDWSLWTTGRADTLEDAWREHLELLGASGYLGVQVYGNRIELGPLGDIRDELARRLGRPVTVGFGPRFLHSTGQFHKGGTPDGVFVHLEVAPSQLVPIPGYPYDFGTLIDAQSWGDRGVLVDRGRPVLTVRAESSKAMMRLLGQCVEWC